MEKMTVELKVNPVKNKLDLSSLSTQIGIIADRKFELPLIERNEGFTKITYKEKSDYKVVSSGVQLCAKGERYSGDTFTTFEDSCSTDFVACSGCRNN